MHSSLISGENPKLAVILAKSLRAVPGVGKSIVKFNIPVTIFVNSMKISFTVAVMRLIAPVAAKPGGDGVVIPGICIAPKNGFKKRLRLGGEGKLLGLGGIKSKTNETPAKVAKNVPKAKLSNPGFVGPGKTRLSLKHEPIAVVKPSIAISIVPYY
jgi:hypothetical protein